MDEGGNEFMEEDGFFFLRVFIGVFVDESRVYVVREKLEELGMELKSII